MGDPRKGKGKRYRLVTLLTLIFLAKLCNQDTPEAITDWAKNHAEELAQLLQLRRSWMPHHNTYRFQEVISADEFEQLMQKYHRQARDEPEDTLAMAGKTLRGTRIADQERGDHILSVYAGQSQRVLAQEVVDSKENEIVAAPKVLEQVSVAGRIITGDAMHTQRAVSVQIIERCGDYLWPVKENQERLNQAIHRLFDLDKPKPGFGKIATDFQSTTQANVGHGWIEKRTLQTSAMLNDYLDWPGVGQVYRLERKTLWVRQGKANKTSCEVEYGITSLSRDKASARKLLAVRRQHWLVETGLHYRREVTFHEDTTRMTIGAAGRILAIVHNLVLSLLRKAGFTNAAQGRRWFAGHIQQAFALLIS